jgi:hypothetical protein
MITTISKDSNLIIDKKIIDTWGLEAGQKIGVNFVKKKIEIKPVRKIISLRGFLSGLSNNFQRENDRI